MRLKCTHSILILLGLAAFSAVGCKKEGCTDAEAFNHQASARVDDGSCYYLKAETEILSMEESSLAGLTTIDVVYSLENTGDMVITMHEMHFDLRTTDGKYDDRWTQYRDTIRPDSLFIGSYTLVLQADVESFEFRKVNLGGYLED